MRYLSLVVVLLCAVACGSDKKEDAPLDGDSCTGTACEDGDTDLNDGGDLDVPGDGDGDASPSDDDGDAGGDDDVLPPGHVLCAAHPAGTPVGGSCSASAGTVGTHVIGDILTPDGVLVGGHIVADSAGLITCVGCDCALAGTETTVDCTGAVVSPALIDSVLAGSYHNVGTFTDERYEHRHQWRVGQDAHTQIPFVSDTTVAKLRYRETRAIMAGTVSIYGSSPTAGLARNLASLANRIGLAGDARDFDQFPYDDSNGFRLTSTCAYPATPVVDAQPAYNAPVAAGIEASAANELACALYDSTAGYVGETVMMQHVLPMTPDDAETIAELAASVVWTPRSDIQLYGTTTPVTFAARLNVNIALGTDVIVTGSMNMLRELVCASAYNDDYLGGYFTSQDLWRMATINGANAAHEPQIGALAVGRVLDVSVFARTTTDIHQSVVLAQPQDVKLVMRGGVALYGDAVVVAALSGDDCDEVTVCETAKRICMFDEYGVTFATMTTAAGPASYPLFFCGEPMNEPTCVPFRSAEYPDGQTADDLDGDGRPNADDDCPDVFNPVLPAALPTDRDGDGTGDACDPTP